MVAGFAHALHDGYTDLSYILLPIWQAEFALGYGVLASYEDFIPVPWQGCRSQRAVSRSELAVV
jgi:hypothetical protein